MSCGATQDEWVMVEKSDRMWSTGERNGKPLQYSCLENPMNSMKRQNDRILKKELPRSVGAHYATGNQWRNNFRKNEGMEPKQKPYPASRGDGIPVELFQILKDELPRLVGVQHATGDQWRNNSRKNEEMELKQKQYPVVDVTGDRSKVRCCKEQY